MNCKSHIIIDLSWLSVKVPAVPYVKALNQTKVFFHPLFIPCKPQQAECHIRKNAEVTPVVLRHIIIVDLIQPTVQILPFRIRKIFPQSFLIDGD